MKPTYDLSYVQDPTRLSVLHQLDLLDTPAEVAFDRLTKLASLITNTPVSLVSLVDADRQFFKSLFGLDEPLASERQTSLSYSFCQYVVGTGEPLIVSDAREDPVLKDNPATTDLGVVAYLGIPLTTSNGIELGSFCVVDNKPRQWTEQEIQIIRELAVSVMTEIELRSTNKALIKEKEKVDSLLLNILPQDAIDELKETGTIQPKKYESVTILFADLVGFTHIAETMPPEQLISELNECFSAFDDILAQHNLERIKTIGDAYMCVGGLPEPNHSHPYDVVAAALDMQAYMLTLQKKKQALNKPIFQLRIGIHTGHVVAGIVGNKKFAYDIWGDDVNIACKFESSGQAGKINISDATFKFVSDQFHCVYRGAIATKNKGPMDMYFVESRL